LPFALQIRCTTITYLIPLGQLQGGFGRRHAFFRHIRGREGLAQSLANAQVIRVYQDGFL
jgi:hypothetical protein